MDHKFGRMKVEGINILDAMKYEQYLRAMERQIQEAYEHLAELREQEETASPPFLYRKMPVYLFENARWAVLTNLNRLRRHGPLCHDKLVDGGLLGLLDRLKASASCQAGASRLDGRYTSLDEFVRQMEAERGEPIAPTDRSKFLYNGSETEISVSSPQGANMHSSFFIAPSGMLHTPLGDPHLTQFPSSSM